MWLSQHEVPHTIIDKAVFPRDKVCGDAVSGRGFSILRQLQPDIMQEVGRLPEALTTYGILFSAPNGKEITFDVSSYSHLTSEGAGAKNPAGFVIKREHFDNFLFNKLNPEYADIRQATALERIERRPDGTLLAALSCDGQTQEVNPKIVIAADGERSQINRQLVRHQQSDKHFAAAVRAYYTNVTGFDSNNSIELHFIEETLPGYLWIFPLPNGGCNVGLGMLSHHVKKGKHNLRKEMLDLLANHPKFKERFAHAKLEGKVLGWGLPLGSKKRAISGDNYLLTGDAASLIDPLTGEGVGNAIISGKYAAVYAMEALKANNFSASFFRERYDHIIYKKLWKELQLSHALQRMASYPTLTNFVFNLATRNPKMQAAIANMFVDIDMRKKIKNPFFYFKMLFGKG
jgi:geranylgeranyl reductase family protein